MRVAVLSGLCLSLLSAGVQAQDVNQLVRVQVGINMFVPGPTGETEEASLVRERARRSVYAMASRECVIILDAFARDCRLESVSVTINRQAGSHQPDGYQVNGNVALRVIPK